MASALIYLALTLVSNAVFNLIEKRVRRGQPKPAGGLGP
jgi:polar amino acid transport system permease protein